MWLLRGAQNASPSLERPTAGAAFPTFEIDRDLLNLASEPEWRLVGEVYGRTDVLTDIQSFADRYLKRNGFWQLAFGDLVAVDRHGHGRALAELTCFAGVSKLYFELHIALGKRSCGRHGVALQRKVVVGERGFAIADVKTVSTF